MKIVFIPAGCIPFNSNTLGERPLGGIETATIHLSKQLANLGHEVVVTTNEPNPPLSSPLYIPIHAIENLGKIDVLISVRGWEPVFSQIKAARRIVWTGDSYDQPQNFGLGDKRVIGKIDYLCPVSKWQQESLCRASGFPIEKTYCLRNGVHLPNFKKRVEKVEKRLIYSSTPYRGLTYLPELFRRVLELHPDASLHVCSGYDVYKGASEYPKSVFDEYKKILAEFSKLPSVKIVGNLKQDKLADEFLEATVLSYPNTFEETSCITVLEAKAANCIPVTTDRAALPESVGKSGICIPGEPGTSDYSENFVKAIDEIFRNSDIRNSFHKQCEIDSIESSWEIIALNFSKFLTKIL